MSLKDKNPAILKLMDMAAKAAGGPGLDALKQNRCPTCGERIGEFRDTISVQEFEISGMCQKCQDSVFSKKSSNDDDDQFDLDLD